MKTGKDILSTGLQFIYKILKYSTLPKNTWSYRVFYLSDDFINEFIKLKSWILTTHFRCKIITTTTCLLKVHRQSSDAQGWAPPSLPLPCPHHPTVHHGTQDHQQQCSRLAPITSPFHVPTVPPSAAGNRTSSGVQGQAKLASSMTLLSCCCPLGLPTFWT